MDPTIEAFMAAFAEQQKKQGRVDHYNRLKNDQLTGRPMSPEDKAWLEQVDGYEEDGGLHSGAGRNKDDLLSNPVASDQYRQALGQVAQPQGPVAMVEALHAGNQRDAHGHEDRLRGNAARRSAKLPEEPSTLANPGARWGVNTVSPENLNLQSPRGLDVRPGDVINESGVSAPSAPGAKGGTLRTGEYNLDDAAKKGVPGEGGYASGTDDFADLGHTLSLEKYFGKALDLSKDDPDGFDGLYQSLKPNQRNDFDKGMSELRRRREFYQQWGGIPSDGKVY